MHLEPGDIVRIQARVVNFHADARIEIADSRGRYSLCIDKAQIEESPWGCRCNERRAAIRGDGATVRDALQFVGRTMIEDARANAARADAIRQSARKPGLPAFAALWGGANGQGVPRLWPRHQPRRLDRRACAICAACPVRSALALMIGRSANWPIFSIKRRASRRPLLFNRTVQETRTAVARALVNQTGMKFGTVRKALTLDMASAASLSAAIVARGGFAPLNEFKARQTRKGASAAPWNTRRVFPGAFIIARYAGHVYKRVSRKRFPLHKLYGPAIPRELPRHQSREACSIPLPALLAKCLNHELGRILGR
jgi:hypothetical protein